MAISTTVIFDNTSGTTATVTGPTGATRPKLLPRHVSSLTSNHQRWTYKTTSTKRWQWDLTFQNLTLANKNALEGFFSETMDGPIGTFEYTHTSGITYAGCNFVDTELNFSRVDGNTWALTVRIELSTDIDH